MNSGDGRLSVLEEAMDELIEKKPYCGDVVNAFRSAILTRNRLVERLEIGKIEPWQPDEIKFQGGLPIIRQQVLLLAEDPWKEIAAAMIPALQEGFPRLRDDLERFATCLTNSDIDLYDYFRSYPDEAEALIEGWASRSGAQPLSIRLFLNNAARVVLVKRAQHVAPLIDGLVWDKGFCPICAAFPMLSVIREKGQRWLHCSVCGHDWRSKRTICPFCEQEGQAGMTYFYVEDEKNESAFACEKCRRYLITLNRAEQLIDVDLDILAVGLTHLDMIMQEKGFQPMAQCPWNQF